MRAAVVAIMFATAISGRAWAQEPIVFLQAQNDAALPPRLLIRAQTQVTRILGMAGLRATWVDRTTDTDRRDLRLTVVITNSRSILDDAGGDILGVAAENERGSGRIAYILWRNVQMLVDNDGLDASAMLGYAMAHEIGHLLLGRGSHSPAGIMRARWGRADLTLAEQGLLRFTDDEAMRIRRRVVSEPLLLANK